MVTTLIRTILATLSQLWVGIAKICFKKKVFSSAT